MNNEIKEILDYLDYGVNNLSISKPPFKIEYEDIKKLLDYITNLQARIEKAVEYVKECYTQPPNIENFMHEGEMNYLLNILNGKE